MDLQSFRIQPDFSLNFFKVAFSSLDGIPLKMVNRGVKKAFMKPSMIQDAFMKP